MKVGLQFTMHIQNRYTVPEIVRLAALAHDQGFDQIWVNDNLKYRSNWVILTAIAAQVPIQIGTSIQIPFIRNPIDVADILASISELTDGREVSLGIAKGGTGIFGMVEQPHALSMVEQTVLMLRQLLAGEPIHIGDYPVPAKYFHLIEDSTIRLAFPCAAPVRFYCGGNGPMSLRIGGRVMDGIFYGGLSGSRIDERMAYVEEGRMEGDANKVMRNIARVNVSISRDVKAARDFPRAFLARPGEYNERWAKLGVPREDVERVSRVRRAGATIQEAAHLVSDAMVDTSFIVGSPEDCVEPLLAACRQAEDLGMEQVMLEKLGPDYEEAIRILGEKVLPAIKG